MGTDNKDVLNRLQQAREPKYKKPYEGPAKATEKRKVVNRIYDKVAKAYKKSHPDCEANLEGCTKETTDIHHQAGKSSEDLLINADYFLGVCRKCHQWIEAHPVEALAKGLSVPRLAK